MSFALPPIKAKPEYPSNVSINAGNFGVPDVMKSGFPKTHTSNVPHPIHMSEQRYQKNRNDMNMALLRNTQGLHAPLRIAMELKAARQIGHLPFLPSSNVMHDVLTGRDLEIGPEDVFNTSEFREIVGQPHAVIEKSLGIL